MLLMTLSVITPPMIEALGYEGVITHWINDPEQATKDLASYSHQYDDTIFWTIFWNPDTWQSDTNIKDATENSLLETAKYTLGLVKYVRG